MVQKKVSNDGQDPYEEVECINTSALTIVLVRVTMLDPFSFLASLNKTNTSLNYSDKERYTGESHE